jgi:hypothetical protein
MSSGADRSTRWYMAVNHRQQILSEELTKKNEGKNEKHIINYLFI